LKILPQGLFFWGGRARTTPAPAGRSQALDARGAASRTE